MSFNGWLILDKPTGITSAKAVAKVKGMLHRLTLTPTLPPEGGGGKPDQAGKWKIGHAGTLDPLASGVLPLALGEATKTVAYAMDGKKAYSFEVTWGQERSTDDAEGQITAESSLRPDRDDIEAILPQFTGEILQLPPAYSALWINGQRAYALARAGQEVNLQPRNVHIHKLEINAIQPHCASFTVHCGKGTYVRSLARDMARAMGACGYISALRRLNVGNFCLTQAISLENLEKLVHKTAIAECLQPVESVLDDIPAWELDSECAQKLAHGGILALDSEEVCERTANLLLNGKKADVWQALHNRRLVAMVAIERNTMKPLRVFNLGA